MCGNKSPPEPEDVALITCVPVVLQPESLVLVTHRARAHRLVHACSEVNPPRSTTSCRYTG